MERKDMNNLIAIAKNAYDRFAAVAASLQNPLLLAVRLYWGWQFEQDGRGKLMHLDRVTDFFATLNLPAPHMTALLVALVEFGGGILLALGIFSRLTSLVLFFNMTMAFLAVPDDRAAFFRMFSKPDDFYGASPYTYWFAALLILILGPGLFAIDTLLKRRFSSRAID
jgi:putative oxidoreductase